MTATSQSFESRKHKILKNLSAPDEDYTDFSPKGSVDAGIRDLIHDINELPGLVTTSSCAGRISIYLEGNKAAVSVKNAASYNRNGDEHEPPNEKGLERVKKRFAATGGKGGGGKWLFVSHSPVNCDKPFHDLFEIVPGDGIPSMGQTDGVQLVRFHFEPMILHIMTATLKHAQPVLAAATAAGFRESGLQSLKNLDDVDAFPIVAVRSSGLALESIIGIQERHGDGDIARSLVSEEYLHMLVSIANERFKTNTERVERFSAKLMEQCLPPKKTLVWEDPTERRARMRMEGLQRKKEMKDMNHTRNEESNADENEDYLWAS